MKLRFKLLGGLVGIVAASAISLAPVAAETPGADVLVFSGTANALGCTGPALGVIPGLPSCNSSGLPYVGGHGSYLFNTGGLLGSICETGGTDTAADPLSSCTISSPGAYDNLVCGTGLASGSATPSGGDNGTINYTIVFAGGVGVIASISEADGVAAAGVVNITPAFQNSDHGSGGLNSCVTAFNVIGVAASVEAG